MISWVAGFLEGEGSFTAQGVNNALKPGGRGHYRTFRGRWPQPAVSAAQVEREPLDRLVEAVGGSVTGPYCSHNPKAAPHYQYRLTGVPALATMLDVFSNMSTKRRRQIEKTLSVWEHGR